jgi:hypothetical protein
MKCKVASAKLAPLGIEIEIKAVDGVDLWKARVANTPIDSAPGAARFFSIGESSNRREDGRIVVLCLLQ